MVIEAMKSEEQDAVWDLLGKAEKRPDVSPTFAQDVARKARQMGKPKVGLFARLFGSEVDELNLLRPAAALGVIAAVAIAIVALSGGPKDTPPPVAETPDAPAVSSPLMQEFEEEIVALEQFDSLLMANNVSELADEDIAMLLY